MLVFLGNGELLPLLSAFFYNIRIFQPFDKKKWARRPGPETRRGPETRFLKQYLRQHRDLRNRVFSKNPVSGGQVSHFLVGIFILATINVKETGFPKAQKPGFSKKPGFWTSDRPPPRN